MKKLFCLILLCSCMLSLVSCSHMGDLEYDENKNLIYHESTYYYMPDFTAYPVNDQELFELGGGLNLPFSMHFAYYAFDVESPLLIWGANDEKDIGHYVYVREDYNPYSATYVIADTDVAISLPDAMTEVQTDFDANDYDDHLDGILTLILKDVPNVVLSFYSLYQCENAWYLDSGEKAWLLSDEFVAQLTELGIINE